MIDRCAPNGPHRLWSSSDGGPPGEPPFAALRTADPDRRLRWAQAPLKPATLATTRLAEHWAHGLDITEPLGIAFPDTAGWTRRLARLRHTALRFRPRRPGVWRRVLRAGRPGRVDLAIRRSHCPSSIRGPAGIPPWRPPTAPAHTTLVAAGPSARPLSACCATTPSDTRSRCRSGARLRPSMAAAFGRAFCVDDGLIADAAVDCDLRGSRFTSLEQTDEPHRRVGQLDPSGHTEMQTRLPARSASVQCSCDSSTTRPPAASAASSRASTCSRATDTSMCIACRSGLV